MVAMIQTTITTITIIHKGMIFLIMIIHYGLGEIVYYCLLKIKIVAS